MAKGSKKNSADLTFSTGVDISGALEDLNLLNKGFKKITEKKIEVPISAGSTEKVLATQKLVLEQTKQINKYVDRTTKIELEVANAHKKTAEEIKKSNVLKKESTKEVLRESTALKDILTLMREEEKITKLSVDANREQQRLYNKQLADIQKRKQEILQTKVGEQSVGKILKEQLSYQTQLNSLKRAQVTANKEIANKQTEVQLLKQQYALELQILQAKNKQSLASLKSELAYSTAKSQAMMSGGMYDSSSFIGKALNTVQYGIVGKMQTEVYNLLYDGMAAVLQYENGIVDLRRTLEDVTENELTEFGELALQYAKEYGRELANVQDAMTELARAGVNKNDLGDMTQTVAIGLNTTEIETADEMVGYLVSAIKQLNLDMSDSMTILDSWNMLADRYAVHTDDFAKAIAKCGATSKNFGLGLYDVNAMVTILGEATQASGEQIGNAIRSLEVRLLRPGTVRTLESYGIAVKKDSEHFLEFEQIISNVADVIKDLPDDSTKLSDIMDAMGGSWRKNWITTLANDWDRYDALIAEQAGNVGYSVRENEVAMDTLEKRITTLKQAWLELFTTMANESGATDSIKLLVSGMTDIVELATTNDVTKFITSMIPMATTMAGITKLMGSMNSVESKGIIGLVGNITSLNGHLHTGKQLVYDYIDSIKDLDYANQLLIAEKLDEKYKTDTKAIVEARESTKKLTEVNNTNLNTMENLTDTLEKITSEYKKGEINEEKYNEVAGKTRLEIEKLDHEIRKNNETIEDNGKKMNTNVKAAKQYSAALAKLRAKMILTQAASIALNMVLGIAITAAITGVIKAADKLYTSFEEQQEITEQLNGELNELKSNLSALEEERNTSTDPQRLAVLKEEIALQKELIALKEEEVRQSIQDEYDKSVYGKGSGLKNWWNPFGEWEYNSTGRINQYQIALDNLAKAQEKNSDKTEEYTEKLKEQEDQVIKQAAELMEFKNAGVEINEEDEKLIALAQKIINARNGETEVTSSLNAVVEELGDALVAEGDAYYFVTKAAKDNAVKTKQIEIQNTKDTIKQIHDRILARKQEQQAIYDRLAFAGGATGMSDTEAARHKNSLLTTNLTAEEKQELEDAQNSLKAYQNALKQIENIGVYSDDSSATTTTTSTTPISKIDDFEAQLTVLDKQAEALRTINELQSDNIDLLEAMYDSKGAISANNELLQSQTELINILTKENSGLDKLKQQLSDEYGINVELIEKWFDVNGNRTLEYYQALNQYVGKTDDASKAAQESLQELADKWEKVNEQIVSNTKEMQEIQNSWMKQAAEIAHDYLEEEQSYREKQLEKQYQEKLNSLQQSVYGMSSDAYDDYIQTRIDALQNELDLMNDIKDSKSEQEEREEKLLAIEKARVKLRNAERNLNVAVLKRQEDGTFQNEYIADVEAVESATEELQQAQKDYDDFKAELERNEIQRQIDNLNKEKELNDKYYEDRLELLEKWHDEQESEIEDYYSDIDNLTYSFLQELRQKYNDNFVAIIEDLNSQMSDMKLTTTGNKVTTSGGNKVTTTTGNKTTTSSGGSSSGGSSSGSIYSGMTDSQKVNEGKYLQGILSSSTSTAGQKTWASNQLKDLYNAYANGGVADYTGLAQMHGTPNHSEVIFNAEDARKLYDTIHNLTTPIPRFDNSWINNLSGGTANTTSTIHIDKISFPNAVDKDEIKAAILELPRVVLQY